MDDSHFVLRVEAIVKEAIKGDVWTTFTLVKPDQHYSIVFVTIAGTSIPHAIDTHAIATALSGRVQARIGFYDGSKTEITIIEGRLEHRACEIWLRVA